MIQVGLHDSSRRFLIHLWIGKLLKHDLLNLCKICSIYSCSHLLFSCLLSGAVVFKMKINIMSEFLVGKLQKCNIVFLSEFFRVFKLKIRNFKSEKPLVVKLSNFLVFFDIFIILKLLNKLSKEILRNLILLTNLIIYLFCQLFKLLFHLHNKLV